MAKGIGDSGQMALGVIGIGGDILHISARAVGGFDQAKAVVGVAPVALSRLSARPDKAAGQRERKEAHAFYKKIHHQVLLLLALRHRLA